jgi:hypothetical protein
MAAFSQYDAALDWARRTAESAWGPIALTSEPFAFEETAFYVTSMGAGLKKIFFAFEELADPGDLPSWKCVSNAWELRYAQQVRTPEPRPLNLDPGYLTEAKLVLATTKDRDHRLYLGQGIYAEGTLYYHRGAWTTRPWTYPDYQRPDYHAFFSRCRELLRVKLREVPR